MSLVLFTAGDHSTPTPDPRAIPLLETPHAGWPGDPVVEIVLEEVNHRTGAMWHVALPLALLKELDNICYAFRVDVRTIAPL
eukprot:6554733-Pyramimonas_sp.AAC.1